MAEELDIASLPFEKALSLLEEIVARLESGKVDLEDSIRIYERGEALRKHCEAKLKEAEATLKKSPSPALASQPAQRLWMLSEGATYVATEQTSP